MLGGALVLAVSATPAAAQQPLVAPTQAEAEATLHTAEQTLASPVPAPGPPAAHAQHATVVLNELAASLPALDGADRRAARGLLSRPTDRDDQYNDGYPEGAPVASAESPHFCVFWVSDPGYPDAPDPTDANGVTDGDGIPDYVEAMLEIAEYSYAVEVAPGALGWAPPKPDTGGCGADPGAHADIYLKQLGKQGLFGYESPDPGQGQKRSQYGYMVLDDDYHPDEYGVFADPLAPAKVTFAHEFNHLLQQNYDSFQDLWMFESTAVWSEEHVYPEINDYVNFVRAFAASPGTPLSDRGAAGGLKIYGAGVWNHWLDARYGSDAILRAWEVSDLVAPADLATAAYDRAIRDQDGNGFSREFVSFAAATAEWRSGLGQFPDAAAYADMKRKGSLNGGSRLRISLDHTAYRLMDVKPAPRIRLTVRAQRGVRSGIALVARDGEELGGSAVAKTRYMRTGGRGSLTLKDAGDYERITAVVANADGRVRGFRNGEWLYARDAREFRIRVFD